MSYIADGARTTPTKPAMIMAGSGLAITFQELDSRSVQLARLLRSRGLRRGDHIAVLLQNHIRFMEPVWACMRAGLYVTTINRFLPADDVAYIVNDCQAKALITSHALGDVAAALVERTPGCAIRFMMDGSVAGYEPYESAVAAQPATPLEDESLGELMLYSSGTTGRPKGILRPLRDAPPDEAITNRRSFNHYDIDDSTVYLTPAPLYHSAPLVYTLHTQARGGTVVLMERFDAEAALEAIETHKVTHGQYVPTMFVRMLKLPPDTRNRYDTSSQKMAMHGAAPCPVDVKRDMIAWWGPILTEYYGGSEGAGATSIDSEEWLAHPGSVGKATLGVLRICDEAGRELPPGETGLIYFERDTVASVYHNDPAATEAARHPVHRTWTTLGDIGRVDAKGYLYLTDRKAFMIISGGVNISPQAVEDAFIVHPKVGDVAVFGVPDPELGEVVKAVIEPAPGVSPSDTLAAELLAFGRDAVAHHAAPRSIDFIETMPRLPTGKLYKRLLRDAYWSDDKKI